MSANRASYLLGLCLDFIAFAALAATLEVHLGIFALASAMFALAVLRGKRRDALLRGSALFVAYAIVVVGSLIAWRVLRWPPVVLAGHAAPLIHALIWFAADTARNRSWRLGVGFVELIIASALTPDIYLPFAIIAFVVIGSVALSCNFLERELEQSGGGATELPASYIRNSIFLSFGIFLTSALIFPILPRARLGAGVGGPAQAGYAEEVRINEITRFGGQSSTPLLRLWTEPTSDFLNSIYLGLVRGKVLDLFDGERWFASRSSYNVLPRDVKPETVRGAVQIEVSKESLNSPILPAPYGTVALAIHPAQGDGFIPARRARGSQWMDFATAYSRARYRIIVDERENFGRLSVPVGQSDEPTPRHTAIPAQYASDRMKRFATRIFGNSRRSGEKVALLRQWFSRGKFTASVTGVDEEIVRNDKSTLTPMERFLFVTQSGHCEFFASSGALLLRLAGVPTRLIAGFRLSKGPVGGVLTVKNTDAHAWFEAYVEGRGWVPVDLTPRVAAPSRFGEWMRDRFDVLSAYWSRYVIGYATDSGTGGPEQRWERLRRSLGDAFDSSGQLRRGLREFSRGSWVITLAVIGAIFVLALLALRTWRPTFFSIHWRVNEGPRALRRERLRMERLLKRRIGLHSTAPREPWPVHATGARLGPAAQHALSEWIDAYESARFGPDRARIALDEIARRRRTFEKISQAS